MADPKPKLIRNLTPYTLRLHFGSKKDPYHVALQPRGLRGDVVSIPGAMVSHQTFSDNVNRSFEIITALVAKKVAEDYPVITRPRHSVYDQFDKVSVERDAEQERVVATFEQTTLNGKEVIRRSRSENMEPQRAAVPGSEDGPDMVRSTPMPRRNKAENESTDIPPFKGIERG